MGSCIHTFDGTKINFGWPWRDSVSNACVFITHRKKNEDRCTQSATKCRQMRMILVSSFKKCKVYADIHRGSLDRTCHITVRFSKRKILNHFVTYFFGNFRHKTHKIRSPSSAFLWSPNVSPRMTLNSYFTYGLIIINSLIIDYSQVLWTFCAGASVQSDTFQYRVHYSLFWRRNDWGEWVL